MKAFDNKSHPLDYLTFIHGDLMNFQSNSNVHGRWVGVVGALRLVDMIVWVNGAL